MQKPNISIAITDVVGVTHTEVHPPLSQSEVSQSACPMLSLHPAPLSQAQSQKKDNYTSNDTHIVEENENLAPSR